MALDLDTPLFQVYAPPAQPTHLLTCGAAVAEGKQVAALWSTLHGLTGQRRRPTPRALTKPPWY